MGLDRLLRSRSGDLVGILNGIGEEWDPRTDPHIPQHFSRESLGGKLDNKKALLEEVGLEFAEGVPLVGMVSRLTAQKGLDLLFETLPAVLAPPRAAARRSRLG